MAHNITNRDQVFAVRDPMWHGLGTVLPEYPTRKQAQTLCHNWEPVTEPLYRAVPVIRASEDGTMDVDTEYEQVSGYVANVRSDTSDMLGVVGAEFQVVTNGEMYDIAEAIEGEDPDSVLYETGGSLKGGSKVWLLLRLRDPLVIAGDPHGATIPYYALQNSHDGSGAFRGQATMTRIVCDNTAQAADVDAQMRGTEFTFRHTKNVRERVEEARDALAGWRESVRGYQVAMDHLVTVRVTPEQQRLFVEEFIPMPPPHAVSDRVVSNVESARAQLRGILDGRTCDGTAHTAYGLVQASIEYNQHVRQARSSESRFKRAYLDRSRITADAIKIAQEVALA